MFGSLSRGGRSFVSYDLCPIEMTKAVQRMLKRPRLRAQRMLCCGCIRSALLSADNSAARYETRPPHIPALQSFPAKSLQESVRMPSHRTLYWVKHPRSDGHVKENPNGHPSKSKENCPVYGPSKRLKFEVTKMN